MVAPQVKAGKNTPLESVSFAVIDIETTGLSHRYGDRICEIAVLRVKGGMKEGSFGSLVNPGVRISSGASRVNGITDRMVKRAPGFEGVIGKVMQLAKGAVIVCHNAPFDLGFIYTQMLELGLKVPGNPVVDTLTIARKRYRFPSNSLGAIARELCIPANNAHPAMGDVLTTHKVLQSFLEDFRMEGMKLGGLLEIQK